MEIIAQAIGTLFDRLSRHWRRRALLLASLLTRLLDRLKFPRKFSGIDIKDTVKKKRAHA